MISTYPLISKSSSSFTNHLVDLDSSCDFLSFLFIFQAFRDSSKCTMWNWYYRHTHNPQVFICFFSWQNHGMWQSFHFLLFSFYGPPEKQKFLMTNYYYFNFLRIFHTSNSWLSFTEICERVNLLNSPELFSEILVKLNSAVVLMVSTLVLISNSSCLFKKHLVTVPSTTITTGITVTLTYHRFIIIYSEFFTSA